MEHTHVSLLYSKLRQHTFWLGRGGSITHAISVIDIALWDLLGKATAQPVVRLLGGRCRSESALTRRCWYRSWIWMPWKSIRAETGISAS